ncbi:MAG: lysylphosphatidylglycerol synthase domain-containing protein, partial [Myxococcota bacterium]
MTNAKSRLFNRLLQALGFAAALAMLWFTFRGLNLAETRTIITRVGPMALLILLPFLVAMMLDTLAWKQQFLYLKRPMPIQALLGVRLASEGVLLSVSGGPVLSEGVAPYILHKRWRVPYSESIATLSVRKALLVVSQALYVGLGAILGFAFLRNTSAGVVGVPGLEWVMVLVSGILLIVSVIFTATLTQGSAGAAINRWLAKVRHRRLTPLLDALRTGLLATNQHLQRALGRTPQDAIHLVIIYFLAWLIEAFETWLILRLLGVDIGFVEVWAFEPALSLLRHLVFFVPAGLGFQDVGYVAFLTAFGVPDPLTVGSAFIVLKRSKELLWAAFGLGLLYLFFRGARAPEANPRPDRPVEGPDIKRVLLICG